MTVDDGPAPPAICSSHYTRSKALTDFKFAGVLPFCILHGESYVFLGAEPVRTGPSGRLWKTMCTSFNSARKKSNDASKAITLSTLADSGWHVEGCLWVLFVPHVGDGLPGSVSVGTCIQGGILEGPGRA